MPDPLDDPERIIAATIERHARRDVAAPAAAIVNELWDAGYRGGGDRAERPRREAPSRSRRVDPNAWDDA